MSCGSEFIYQLIDQFVNYLKQSKQQHTPERGLVSFTFGFAGAVMKSGETRTQKRFSTTKGRTHSWQSKRDWLIRL